MPKPPAGSAARSRMPRAGGATPARSEASRPPLYQRLVAVLRDEIIKGIHPVGSKLPTEEELTARFEVSRHTVREALRQLRLDGLVSSRRGAGTTVCRPGGEQPYVHEVQSINDLIQYAASTEFKAGDAVIVQSDVALAALIGGDVGQQWLRIEGMRYADEPARPVCWTQVYIRREYAGVSRLVGRQGTAVYELIEQLYGVRIAAVTQVVQAHLLPGQLAQRLDVDPGSMGIEVVRTYRLTTGAVAEVAVNYYPAERFKFSMTLRRACG